MDKKTMFLAVLSVTSLIICGDLATQLQATQRQQEATQQKVEVLTVQANEKEKVLKLHDQWFFEYIETGYIEDLQQSVDRYMESGTQQKIENQKGGNL